MKLATTAFVLAILLLGACGFLFWQGYQDRQLTEGRSAQIDDLNNRVEAMEGGAGRQIVEGKMERARLAAERETFAAKNAELERQVEALKAERAVLERNVAGAPGTADAASPGAPAIDAGSPGALPPLGPPPGGGAATVVAGDPSTLDPKPLPASINDAPLGDVLTPVQQKIKEAPAIGAVQEYYAEEGFVVINAGSDARLNSGDVFALRRDTYLVGKVRISTVEATQSIGDIVADSIPVGMTVQGGDAVIMQPAGL